MSDLVEKSKLHFYELFDTGDSSIRLYDMLPRHLEVLEKWTDHLLDLYPEADKDVVMMGVWLHDAGQLVGIKEEDHAVRSEREVLKFLPSIGAADELTQKVAHCVRAHRCKDVQPGTIEAKILAAADSASHFTDAVYIDMVKKMGKKEPLAKLERDFRDSSIFPDLKAEITPLYEAWKVVLLNFPDWFTPI